MNPAVLKKDWQAFAMRLRWKAVQVLAPRRRVYSRGLTFTLPSDNWVTFYRWRSYNSKEPETLDWIDQRVRDGDVLFDVGANIGLYSIYAALRHPHGRVVAFEPEYSNLHLLRDNLVENHLQDRVEPYSIALSNQTGLSFLHLQDVTPGSALHTASTEPLQKTNGSHPVVLREGITTITLDAFCEKTGIWPNCLKIDVDGTEDLVLEGGLRALSSKQFRTLIIELPDPALQKRSTQWFVEAGLTRQWRDPQGRTSNEVWVRRD